MRATKRFRISLCAAAALAVGIAGSARALPPEPEELPPVEEAVQEPYAPVELRDDHDPKRAAHPIRIVAYALHPVGVTLDWLVVRPAVWVVRHEPFRSFFGYED